MARGTAWATSRSAGLVSSIVSNGREQLTRTSFQLKCYLVTETDYSHFIVITDFLTRNKRKSNFKSREGCEPCNLKQFQEGPKKCSA